MKLKMKKNEMQRQNQIMIKNRNIGDDIPNFKHRNHNISDQKPTSSHTNKKNGFRIKEKKQKKSKNNLAFIVGGVLLSVFLIRGLQPAATDELSRNYKYHKNNPSNQIQMTERDLDEKTVSLLKKGIMPPNLKHLPWGYKKQIQKGNVKIYAVTLFDNCAEDGDVVRVKVNGIDLGEVPLTHAGATVSVPLSSSGNDVMSVIGVKDGQGGITVTFRTSQGEYYSKVMQPGETITVKCEVM
ncbi:hypothetical protein MHK_006222 [Candidatus Magnetomorum sp. HK-1]|nr:hypothetical protein MHK_006222 [Candidatus Magnetomorum sp. HK-1]